MASATYREGLFRLLDRSIDFANDTIKVMLVDSDYTFSQSHDRMDDINGEELSGTGYTSGFASSSRRTLGSKTITLDTGNNRVEYDAADPSAWTSLSAGTIGGAVIYKHITDDATSTPIWFLDPTNLVTNGGNVTLVFDAEGFGQIAV